VTIGSIRLGLLAGSFLPEPVPAALLRLLRSVEVTQPDNAAATFRLTFTAEAAAGGVVAEPLLQPFQRVLVRVTVDGAPATLVDGFVTGHEYAPANGPGDGTLVVTGEDVSVAMDVVDYSREFPAMPDPLVVLAILAPWLALGIVPAVVPTLTALVPFDHVPQQAGTDRQTIRQLAESNGCVFFVRPLPVPSPLPPANVAYWGPPPRIGPTLAVLDLTTGPFGTVESATFGYDGRAPTTFFGVVMETSVDPYLPVPVVTLAGMRFPALATEPGLDPLSPMTRRKLWCDQELDPVRAYAVAQGRTDASTDAVVTGTCEVDPLRIGTVVTPPGLVGVRGAGRAYDGLYYLRSATHRIALGQDEQWSYRQALDLTREGVGTTTETLVRS
jgi:hypothetical protein